MGHIDELKEDFISVLKDSLKALKRKDISLLKELSNHTIHDAGMFQDKESISLAIAIYAISKIIEREKKIDPRIELNMHESIRFIAGNDMEGFNKNMQKLFKIISEKDTKLKLYIDEVFRQARIKKGGKIYEHGISIGQASEILGISQWELMSYVGKTRISDYAAPKVSAQQRMAVAREIFNMKQYEVKMK